MTDDDIRARHVKSDERWANLCVACSKEWPCDTARETARADAAEAAANEWSEKAAVLAVDAYRAEQARDAARALADELGMALDGMVKKWGSHSGSCCTFDSDGKVIVTVESCKCDMPEKDARAALAKWEASK